MQNMRNIDVTSYWEYSGMILFFLFKHSRAEKHCFMCKLVGLCGSQTLFR